MNLPSIVQEGKTFLEKHGYIYEKSLLRGFLFVNKIENQAIIIDFDICNCAKPFHYVQYTKEQNLLMSSFDRLYRFVVDTEKDLIEFVADFNIILSQSFDENGIKFSGTNRSLVEIDPSVPEAYFEQAFIDIYGNEALESVLREEPFIDMNSQTRYIDYLIGTRNGKIAVEKNGESYHHPIIIGKERYKKQLVKQNSIVANNIKIFRWSLEGMKAKDSFYEELRNVTGVKDNLVRVQKLNVTRKIKLFSHQEVTINTIAYEREHGATNFLVVLPTGTGKTEIYIADMINEIKKGNINRILVLVPQVSIRSQTIDKIKIRLSEEGINKSIGNNLGCDIAVVTSSFISRRYYELEQQHFDYIVVDEAHHSVAPTLSRVIQYFTPKTLIGLTATDRRLDERRLEDIFGKYEVAMSLKEAIETEILAPIKVFRVESNIDLSEVRFNGRDYVGTDLQRTLIVPTRDKLIVDVLNKYFSLKLNGYKSGIIFCVSVKHAENLAKLMKAANFTCEAVSGSNQKSENYINEYQNGKIQFLTTCSLLNEGWDSPRTSIIVMARPTLSKVLYTQQLGRGTRKMEGKEALYVIDVVDNYGAYGNISNRPWSLHALLGIGNYKPFADVLNPNLNLTREELFLDSIYEEERKLKPIDIFTFEEIYSDYYSDEKLARELYVSTGTIKSWVKKGTIEPSIVLKIGSNNINYYSPDYKDEIIKKLQLNQHDDTTIYQDFFEFLEQRDYSLSYKMIMILSIIKITDINGEVNLDDLVEEYSHFYKYRLDKNLEPDRKSCPFTTEFLNDNSKMKQNIIINPFEKFERKRFMHYAKDLNIIMFSSMLWKQLNNENDISRIKTQMFEDLTDYYKKMETPIDEVIWQKYWGISGNFS